MTNAKRNGDPGAATAIDLTVVIPAYNEEQRLGSTVAELFSFLAARGGRFEILVVDDGSTDGTVALCRALAAHCPALQVIPTTPNRGKGHAVRIGMMAARGALVVTCDADGSTPAAEIPRLLRPILDGRNLEGGAYGLSIAGRT